MKKNMSYLILLLMMFAILPHAASGESPTTGMIEPALPSESGAAVQQGSSLPSEGIHTRFAIPNALRQSIAGDLGEKPAPSSGDEPASPALDIGPIDAEVQTFGGRGNERLIDVISLSDGGFLLTGNTDIENTNESGQTQAAWALRFSQKGEKLWEYKHQNKESIGYFGMAKENPDGTILLHYVNILFNLRTHSLITLSGDGDLLSDSPMSSLVYKVYRAADGIIVDSGSGLTKYNADLSIQYELEDVTLQHIEFSTEDGLLFYGYLLREESNLGDAVVFKLNENGDIQWDMVIQQNARLEGCVTLSNGDYLCAGYMESDAGYECGLAARIGSDGTVRYVQEYRRDGEHFFISHAYELKKGALLVGGSNKQNHIYLLHIDEDGNEIRRYIMELGSRVELTSTPLRVIQAGDNLFIAGDLVYYRNLLQPEDADFFIVPLVLPAGLE